MVKRKFENVPEDILKEKGEGLFKYAKAYILFLMGTILFSDDQKQSVFVGYLVFLKGLAASAVTLSHVVPLSLQNCWPGSKSAVVQREQCGF